MTPSVLMPKISKSITKVDARIIKFVVVHFLIYLNSLWKRL